MRVYVVFEYIYKGHGEPIAAFSNEADAIAYAKQDSDYDYRELEVIFPIN